MKKKWNVKKSICLGALILNYLPFLCFLFPAYFDKEPMPVHCNMVDYVSASDASRIVFFFVSYGLFFVAVTVAAVFFLKAIFACSGVGDEEDKYYVFGFVFMILGNLILGITMFGQNNYIPMVWSLGYIILALAMIILHFKKLSVA